MGRISNHPPTFGKTFPPKNVFYTFPTDIIQADRWEVKQQRCTEAQNTFISNMVFLKETKYTEIVAFLQLCYRGDRKTTAFELSLLLGLVVVDELFEEPPLLSSER